MAAEPTEGFDAQRLRHEVERLAQPEGRRVGTPGHDVAQGLLSGRLAGIGLAPYGDAFALPYGAGGHAFANLVGVASGRDREAPPVLIAAHYDTAGDWPGADDNAAAVAIALEVAARLVAEPAARDVVIALFDAEEPPFFQTERMGSVHFYERQATGPVHAALVMDLVGHALPLPGVEDLVFVTGMESDPGLQQTMNGLSAPEGARFVTALNAYVGDMSDHHVFRLNRVPYLFLSCGHWAHYHEPSDTPDRLDHSKMAAIAGALEEITRDVASRRLDGPWEGYDTTPTDLATMRAAFGDVARQMGLRLEGRRDIDRLARHLIQTMGL
ncbi:MAG: M28 family peptidase [Trueperaceae bacterium]|nr:M28 family peptidase [Trueperaceae bacterium]